MNHTPAFHGGKSFEAIGEDFRQLDRAAQVINADVLDAWFDPSPCVLSKIRHYLPFLIRTSPPVYSGGLVAAIARARDMPANCILTGAGSSDLIFTCLPRLTPRPRNVMILDPMYGEYRHLIETVMGGQILRFDLHKEEDFRIDTDRLIASVRRHRPNLLVIVNPNSPSGQYWPRRDVVRLLDSIPSSTQIVIDETYIEYAGRENSLESEASRRPGLLVLKSMSKTYALSGMRVGYLVGVPSTVRDLSKWIPPWAVSLPAQVAAVEALGDEAYYEAKYRETHLLREKLVRNLRRNPHITTYPSTTNFVSVETRTSAQRILERMRESNVFVRNCDSMGERFADRFLRIAVKSRTENSCIADALFDAC
ncbi:MAG TPA: histidinol-phosphate transaminase [Bryobacteraceae bacterium]|nr:histidinol-phosphate transaminase [Bryobacteraceae bacterium]